MSKKRTETKRPFEEIVVEDEDGAVPISEVFDIIWRDLDLDFDNLDDYVEVEFEDNQAIMKVQSKEAGIHHNTLIISENGRIDFFRWTTVRIHFNQWPVYHELIKRGFFMDVYKGTMREISNEKAISAAKWARDKALEWTKMDEEPPLDGMYLFCNKKNGDLELGIPGKDMPPKYYKDTYTHFKKISLPK